MEGYGSDGSMLVTMFVETTSFALSREEGIVTKIGQSCAVDKVNHEKKDEDDHRAYEG
jgi:hypothetical protein